MRTLANLACLLALGCAPAPAPSSTTALPPQAPPSAVPPEKPAVSMHVTGAGAFEVLAGMEQFCGEPVLVDASALPSLRCAEVNVDILEPVPGRVAAEKIATVLRAQRYRVEHAGGRWVISTDPGTPPAACGGAEPEPAKAGGEGQVVAEILQAIRPVSETEIGITRRGVDLLFEHGEVLSRRVRTVPEKEGDKVVGIRIFGVRPDGVAYGLGIRNGDRAVRFAGKALQGPFDVAEALEAARKATRAELELVRHGSPMKIVYRVE